MGRLFFFSVASSAAGRGRPRPRRVLGALRLAPACGGKAGDAADAVGVIPGFAPGFPPAARCLWLSSTLSSGRRAPVWSGKNIFVLSGRDLELCRARADFLACFPGGRRRAPLGGRHPLRIIKFRAARTSVPPPGSERPVGMTTLDSRAPSASLSLPAGSPRRRQSRLT